MNREEKIQLLKKVQSGDFSELLTLKNEARMGKIQDEYFVPCFFYLLENETFVDRTCNMIRARDAYLTRKRDNTNEIISIFKDGYNCSEKDNNYSRASFEALLIFKDIVSTLNDLDNSKNLQILDPYKKRKL